MTKAQYYQRLLEDRDLYKALFDSAVTKISFFAEESQAASGIIPAGSCKECGQKIPATRESEICAFCWAQKVRDFS